MQSQEAILKKDALTKYQENAYLLGRIFSTGAQPVDARNTDATSDDDSFDSPDEEQQPSREQDEETLLLLKQLDEMQSRVQQQMSEFSARKEKDEALQQEFESLIKNIKGSQQRGGCSQEVIEQCQSFLNRATSGGSGTNHPVFAQPKALEECDPTQLYDKEISLWENEEELGVVQL